MQKTKTDYFNLSATEAIKQLDSSKHGLTAKKASARLKQYGSNVLASQNKHANLKILLKQFKSPLALIVILAAISSIFLKHYTDSAFIVFVVLINIIVSYIQESKAEKALEKMKNSVRFYSKVFRNGLKKQILSSNIVPGDIVQLLQGDKVPADGRIIWQEDFSVNESMLTGETLALPKTANKLGADKKIYEQANMVFMGSSAESGKALMVVTATGGHSQIGKISLLVKNEKKSETPLQKKFYSFSKIMGAGIIAIIIVTIAIGTLRGFGIDEILITSVALIASVVPEGLLPSITVALVLGMRRLSKKKALVRKLDSNESMGAVTVICFDKTGTLTKGEMQVSKIITGEKELLSDDGNLNGIANEADKRESHVKLLEITTLVNNAYIENPGARFSDWIVRGQPTDKALLLSGISAGIRRDELEKERKLLKSIPFSSEAKFALSFYKTGKDEIAVYLVGSPENAIGRSNRVDLDGHSIPISSAEAKNLVKKSDRTCAEGLRVIACAWKTISRKEYENEKNELQNLAKNLRLVGFIAFKDPLRKDVKNSLETARKAGIRPVVVTGDHKNTAVSILAELGIKVGKRQVFEGWQLDGMDETALQKASRKALVFARVLPKDKIRIVRALQNQNNVVAMVGDGINDAPALKAADVGVALGSGADIAKEVSDIVVLNNSFTTIIKAIEQGRLIFENIRRQILYLIADDFSELFLFLVVLAIGLPLPLLPIQILWINLVEDGFPNMALAMENNTDGLMEEKPRKPGGPIFENKYRDFAIGVFLVSGIFAVLIFILSLFFYKDVQLARTMAFVLMAIDSLAFAYCVKSLKHSIVSRHIFSNKYLNLAVFISLSILIAGIYFAPLQNFLQVSPLDYFQWSIILCFLAVEIILIETFKHFFIIRKNETTT